MSKRNYSEFKKKTWRPMEEEKDSDEDEQEDLEFEDLLERFVVSQKALSEDLQKLSGQITLLAQSLSQMGQSGSSRSPQQ